MLKKITNILSRILFTAVIFLFSHQTSAEPNSAPPALENLKFEKVDANKIPDELLKISSIIKANYDKIKTWQGKVLHKSTNIFRGKELSDILKNHPAVKSEPNELSMTYENTIEFKIDAAKDLLFRRVDSQNTIVLKDVDKGISYNEPSGILPSNYIIGDKYEIECSPNSWDSGGNVTGRSALKFPRNPFSVFSEKDPRGFYYIGSSAWELLKQLKESIRLYGNMNVFVLEKAETAEGIIYQFQIVKPGAASPDLKFILDGRKAFNPTYIEYYRDDGKKMSDVTTDFAQIQDVYVPIQNRTVIYNTDGLMRKDSKTTLTDIQLNMQLPENTFELGNLGMQDGDNFYDAILKKKYIYRAATKSLEPVEKTDKK